MAQKLENLRFRRTAKRIVARKRVKPVNPGGGRSSIPTYLSAPDHHYIRYRAYKRWCESGRMHDFEDWFGWQNSPYALLPFEIWKEQKGRERHSSINYRIRPAKEDRSPDSSRSPASRTIFDDYFEKHGARIRAEQAARQKARKDRGGGFER